MLQSLYNGRYTVLRPLGQGGMGALFLATDHGAFERTVVVKVLLEGPPGATAAARGAARARVAPEARPRRPAPPLHPRHFRLLR